MDKNYYEILQIDRNASPEIIEKAYKTLAKKYHPDLQDEAHKKEAEEKFKIINEAYQTLSNPQLKASYDQNILDNNISQEQYEEMYKQNQILKNELNNLHRQQTNSQTTQNNNMYNNVYNTPQNTGEKRYKRDLEYENEVNRARQQAYHDAYIQDLKNRGYKIKYKKTFSDYLKGLISIIVVILILYILWHIPFIQNYFINLYNNNFVFHYIGNIFINLFN